MKSTRALVVAAVASLSAPLVFARVASGDSAALAGDASRVATMMADGGATNPQPGTPIYPGPAPGIPGMPPGANPGSPPTPPTPNPGTPSPPPPNPPPAPTTPPGANPGTNPGVNPGANPGNPGNAPGMNPGAGHGTPGSP
jgi:hypothetical protein